MTEAEEVLRLCELTLEVGTEIGTASHLLERSPTDLKKNWNAKETIARGNQIIALMLSAKTDEDLKVEALLKGLQTMAEDLRSATELLNQYEGMLAATAGGGGMRGLLVRASLKRATALDKELSARLR